MVSLLSQEIMTTNKTTKFKLVPYRRAKTAAIEVGYSRRHIYRLIESGRVDSVNDDGLILVCMSSLYSYISLQNRKRAS